MPITFKVPAKLVPLKPVLEWFSNIPDDELNEDTNLAFVDSFLRSRYGGLSFDDAETKLEADKKALAKLCEAHGQNSSWLYFFLAYLNPHILPHLIEEQEQEDTVALPPLTLHIDLPDDYRVTHDFGSVLANNSSVNVSFVPTAESVLEFKLSNFRHRAQWAVERAERNESPIRVEYSFDEVDWGEVKGWRVIVNEASPRKSKEIHYLLKVPGGASIVDVECKNTEFQEKSLENLLPNLMIQSNPPVGPEN